MAACHEIERSGAIKWPDSEWRKLRVATSVIAEVVFDRFGLDFQAKNCIPLRSRTWHFAFRLYLSRMIKRAEVLYTTTNTKIQKTWIYSVA